MSRYSECDDDSPEAVLAYGRWEHNSRAALKGKRGRKALAELREALLALPQKRLIEGAVCTVGAAARREALAAEATRTWESADPRWRGASPWMDEADELDRLVRRDGEGVCAVGAFIWYRKVRAGTDPAEAFASLPDLPEEGSDGLSETAEFAKQQAGLTYTLAWELAYRNDETYVLKTPEERYAAFLAWIDAELGGACGGGIVSLLRTIIRDAALGIGTLYVVSFPLTWAVLAIAERFGKDHDRRGGDR